MILWYGIRGSNLCFLPHLYAELCQIILLCSLASLFNQKEISEGNLLNHLALWLLIWTYSTLLQGSKHSKVIGVKQVCWDTVHSRKKKGFYITLMSTDWSLLQCGGSPQVINSFRAHLPVLEWGPPQTEVYFKGFIQYFIWKFIFFVTSSQLGSS